MSDEYRIEVNNAHGLEKAINNLVQGEMSTPKYMIKIESESKIYIALHVKNDENRILFFKIIDTLLGCGDGLMVFDL